MFGLGWLVACDLWPGPMRALFSLALDPNRAIQSPWIYLLMALGLIGVGVAGYRLRVRHLTGRTQQWEQAVQTQTDEIRRQKEAAERANELKTQLLHIAAHDMKNPLTAIRGFAEMINRGIVKEERAVEVAKMIVDASDRMLNLVTELLDSATIESDDFKLDRQRVDIRALAGSVVKYNQPLAQHKGQRLLFADRPEGPCIVHIDPERMREVMDNLVSNAIKYSPLEKTIWIRLRANESGMRFEVEDEGPGLSQDDQRLLFEPFQRLSPAPTGDESSTGLGLSIVKKLVDLHGGSIRAESRQGQGSTFIVTLPPLSEREPAMAALPSHPAA